MPTHEALGKRIRSIYFLLYVIMSSNDGDVILHDCRLTSLKATIIMDTFIHGKKYNL